MKSITLLVTDHGKRLWKDTPAEAAEEDGRAERIDAELDPLLGEPESDFSLSKIVDRSRR